MQTSEQIKKLEADLQAIANELIARNPQAQRLVGQLDILRGMQTSKNGTHTEILEEVADAE